MTTLLKSRSSSFGRKSSLKKRLSFLKCPSMKHSCDPKVEKESNDDDAESTDGSTDDWMESISELTKGVGDLFSGMNGKSQEVALKIESSLNNPEVEKLQNEARPYFIWNEPVPLPNMPRFACVGRVITETSDDCEIKKGDRVATMISHEEDFELYAKAAISNVIKVPEDIDACKVLVLMITYMTAYQSLSVDDNVLKNKRVLVVGGVGPVCQACIELAIISGARVYVPALREYHVFLSRMGVKPIDCHPQDWKIKDGSMDLIIDAICTDELKTPKKKLAPNGRLVSIGSSAMDAYSTDDDFLVKVERFWFLNTARYEAHITFYGLMRSWENDRDIYKRDLNHLFYLFSKGKIRPKVAAYASLEEYPKLRSGIKGTVVCVPSQETSQVL